MDQGSLQHGKYTIDISAVGCSVHAIEEGQKIFLCGGISDPELAMAIVEGLILVEAKRFYKPDAERVVTTAQAVKNVPHFVQDGKTVPHFLKKD